MSWRAREDNRSRWVGDNREREPRDNRWREREPRPREPVWELRRSAERYVRERHDRFDHNRRDGPPRDRYDDRRSRDDERRDRDRRRERDTRDRDTRTNADEDVPNPPSPPKISAQYNTVISRSKSKSIEKEDPIEEGDQNGNENQRNSRDGEENPTPVNLSPGDWFCKCGSYNFKRRQVCFRRNCFGKKTEGTIFGGDEKCFMENSGITKRLLFRRLDALTTEEKILESIKDRCSKEILDSIAGITIGRETLTGASKCLAYINFNSIADSTAAHTELLGLKPPLKIDGREVLISYYNEPQKMVKAPDYSAYYSQMGYSNTLGMSEADRVNAAAAVAQSAISAAHARNLTWTPVIAPTFVTPATVAAINIPTGDGKTVYTAPDVRTFLYDETSGYYYDPATGLYYDGKTQYFFNNQTSQYMYWDASTSTYIAATQSQQNTEQPKLPNPPEATLENTITKEPEEKKKKNNKDDQVKVAKKIAKDMERWARTLNQKKENARSNIVMEQPLDMGSSKGSADIGFSVLGAGPSLAHNPTATAVREISPPVETEENFLLKRTEPEPLDSDDGIIDWAKLTCLLCKRRFPSAEVLNKHKTLSDLHKQNLAEFRKREDSMPQPNGYRDRAAERRMKFGEDEPIVNKRYIPPEPITPTVSAPPPNVVDTIGGRMLQKMGWSEGRGLGKTEQGRTAPIEAAQRPALVGLGQKKGIYTPTAGETYRDTVKKLMIARYKEVVGDDD